MITRDKAIIGMIAGLTAVSIIIGGCYTDETPESSLNLGLERIWYDFNN